MVSGGEPSHGGEPLPSGGDGGPQANADPQWLLREPSGARSSPAPESKPPEPGGAYEVEGLDGSGTDAPDAPIVPPVPVPPRAKPKPAITESERPPATAAPVDPVWSRWAEWGPTLKILAGIGLGTAFLIYVGLASGLFGLAFFALFVGGSAMVILSYPIAITLERPVRVTPEQAVNDFYTALSHHLPHYRRMWFLLSSAGRTSPSFSSLEQFQAYWTDRLSALRGTDRGLLTPLRFTVDAFRSDKSGGLSAVEVHFRLGVSFREQPDATIASYHVATSLSRGPDRMWYLDSGTLPEPDEASPTAS